MTSGIIGSVASLLAASLFEKKNNDNIHKLMKISSNERYIFRIRVLLECCYIKTEISQKEN
jgi:hypothetical protein